MSKPIAAFEYAKLGEHADILAGPPFNSAAFTDKPEDIPLVKGENVQQGYVDWNIAKRWPATDTETYKRFKLVPGDVVVAMDRPWVTAGLKWAYIKRNDPSALLVQRVARLRGKKTLDQGFLRCLISSAYFSNYIQPIVTGVNVPHISGKQIGDFKIPVLPLATQQKIAATLSTYDDLIANNQRRITLLERMAEDIYREWFVRLRFPGHESTPREKGIPRGWRIRGLGDILELCYGKALKDEVRVPGIVPVYGSGGVVGTHNASLVDGPGIVVGRKGNVGSVFWSDNAFFPIDTAYFVRSGTSLHYLFFLLQSMNFINNDSAVPGLSRQQAYSNKLLFPPDELIKQFSVKAESLFKMKQILSVQVELLKATRDALLPRLISGKLSVDALDIRFPPGMLSGGKVNR